MVRAKVQDMPVKLKQQFISQTNVGAKEVVRDTKGRFAKRKTSTVFDVASDKFSGIKIVESKEPYPIAEHFMTQLKVSAPEANLNVQEAVDKYNNIVVSETEDGEITYVPFYQRWYYEVKTFLRKKIYGRITQE